MSLFHGKHVVSVSAGSVKLFEEYPNPIREVVNAAIILNAPILESILVGFKNNYGTSVDKFVRYAEKKPKATDTVKDDTYYYYGLPDGTVSFHEINHKLLQEIIAKKESVVYNDVKIISARLDTLSVVMAADTWLIKNRPGFDVRNRKKFKLLTYRRRDYFYDSVDYQYRIMRHWYDDPGPPIGVSIIVATYVDRNAGDYDAPVSLEKRTRTIDIPFSPGDKWYQCYYTIASDPTNIRTFVYNTESKPPQYPQLIAPDTPLKSDFLPVIPIKSRDRFLSEFDDKREASVRKALKYLDFDLDNLEAVMESNENANKLQHAFVNFRIPLRSQEEESKRYLYDFFMHMYGILGEIPIEITDPTISREDDNDFGTNREYDSHVDRSILEIREDLMEYHFAIESITVSEGRGKIGEIGTIKNSKDVEYLSTTFKSNDPDSDSNPVVRTPYHSITKQITKSRIRVIKVQVTGIEYITAFNKYLSAEYDLVEAPPAIPILRSIIDKYDTIDRDKILRDSVHLTVYAADRRYVKWYRTGAFLGLLKFVTIVLMIVFPPAGMAAQTFMGYLITFSYYMSFVMIISSDFASKMGWFGTVLGAINIAVAWSTAIAKGLASSLMSTASLLMDTVALTTGIYTQVLTKKMEDMQRDFIALDEKVQEAWDEYDSAERELFPERFKEVVLDPFLLLETASYDNEIFDFNESPTDFYERTVGTPNPGVAVLDGPSNFVANMLTLPEPYIDDMIPDYKNPGLLNEMM